MNGIGLGTGRAGGGTMGLIIGYPEIGIRVHCSLIFAHKESQCCLIALEASSDNYFICMILYPFPAFAGIGLRWNDSLLVMPFRSSRRHELRSPTIAKIRTELQAGMPVLPGHFGAVIMKLAHTR